MKRTGNLFDQIATIENFRLAYYQAAKGKRDRREVISLSECLDRRLEEIVMELDNGKFPFGRFSQFMIRDPKIRIITAPFFEERVVHHAIMNVCLPNFERWLIEDTYACRSGKGREKALKRALQFSGSSPWCLKLDIKSYFDSVNHDLLIRFLGRRFKDLRLMQLLKQIIQSFRGQSGIGLPIGSLMSQHFANFYLGFFDRFIKETLRVEGYVRYMDDMLIWSNSKSELITILQESQCFVNETLKLKFKQSTPLAMKYGINFLGCKIFPTHLELNQRSKRRWKRRVNLLEKAEKLGLINELELQQRLNSLTAFAKSAGVKSWQFRNSTLKYSR